MTTAILYAQLVSVPVQPGGPSVGRMPGFLGDVLLVLGVGLGILGVLLLWAKYVRRRSRHGSSHRLGHRLVEDEDAGSGHRHRRHRRRRRDHRPRNPTLAETGGLPPPKPQDPPPASA